MAMLFYEKLEKPRVFLDELHYSEDFFMELLMSCILLSLLIVAFNRSDSSFAYEENWNSSRDFRQLKTILFSPINQKLSISTINFTYFRIDINEKKKGFRPQQ